MLRRYSAPHCMYLIRVSEKVIETHEGRDELAVDKVVGLVYRSQAPVCVVVGIGAEAEWSI